VEEALPGAAGDGRADLGVAEIELGVGHGGLLRMDLGKRGLFLGEELAEEFGGDDRLGPELTVARGVLLRDGELGASRGELGARDRECVFKRMPVERDQQVAGLDGLAFLKMDRQHHPIDLRTHLDTTQRLDRADGLFDQRDGLS